jgi:hypothetical protein
MALLVCWGPIYPIYSPLFEKHSFHFTSVPLYNSSKSSNLTICSSSAHEIRPERSRLASTTSIQYNRTTTSLCAGWWIDQAEGKKRRALESSHLNRCDLLLMSSFFLCSVFPFPSPFTIYISPIIRDLELSLFIQSQPENPSWSISSLKSRSSLFRCEHYTLFGALTKSYLSDHPVSVVFNIQPIQSCHNFFMCMVGGLMKLRYGIRDGMCSALLIHFALRAHDAFIFSSVSHRLSLFFSPGYPRPDIILRTHIMVLTRKPIVVHPSPLTAEILCYSLNNWILVIIEHVRDLTRRATVYPSTTSIQCNLTPVSLCVQLVD